MSSEDEQPTANLSAEKPGIPVWNANDVPASLHASLIYVEREANKAITWYWVNKRSKAFFSQIIHIVAFSLTALGGLFPIAVLMLNPLLESMKLQYKIPESGLASSLFVGIAASLYGLDKAFGLSSGWTRYVLTATILEKSLEEFRLQWTLLISKVGQQPTPDQIDGLLKCAKDFRLAVAGAVLQETKDWVTEFQNNLGELERDARAQLETLNAKVEKSIQVQAENNNPGAVSLTVTDANLAGFLFEVTLEGQRGIIRNETVVDGKSWTAIGLEPGQYRLGVVGKVAGAKVSVAKVLIVKSHETTEVQAQLQL